LFTSDTLSPVGDTLSPVGDTLSPVGDTLSPVGDTLSPVGDTLSPVGDIFKRIEITTEISTETTTTTTPNPSFSNARSAEPEPARGGGAQDEKTKVQDTHHGIATLEPNEEKTVSQGEGHSGQGPELVYPAKLTEAEYADITTQVDPLPPEIAQQMLDVVESRMQSGHIRTNPAAVLRGILRKYHIDPGSFDPSSGFQIAEARRRRAEAEARLRAAAEARRPYETATGIPHRRSEEQRRNARKFVDEALSILRG
jgi:hypothetical protein